MARSSRIHQENRTSSVRSQSERPAPLDIPCAAAYLGTSVRHVRRLVAERRLTSYRLGGKVLLSPDDLDRLLERGRREALR
jgi:excisionase family DNA binding protein